MADQQKYVPDPPQPPPYPFTNAEGTGADSMLAPPPYSHNSEYSLAGPPGPPGNSAPKSGRGLNYNQNPVPDSVSYTSSSRSVVLQPQAPPLHPEQPARWNGRHICTCNSMPPACLAIVLGVCACVCGSWLCAIPAIVLGVAALQQPFSSSSRWLSCAGTVLGCCGIITFVVWLVILIVSISASSQNTRTTVSYNLYSTNGVTPATRVCSAFSQGFTGTCSWSSSCVTFNSTTNCQLNCCCRVPGTNKRVFYYINSNLSMSSGPGVVLLCGAFAKT